MCEAERGGRAGEREVERKKIRNLSFGPGRTPAAALLFDLSQARLLLLPLCKGRQRPPCEFRAKTAPLVKGGGVCQNVRTRLFLTTTTYCHSL